MSILGGFLGTVYTHTSMNAGTAINRGVITRFNPVLDPGNINVRGTGERGLYDVLLGFRQPRFTIEFMPQSEAWIKSIQDGSAGIEFLFLHNHLPKPRHFASDPDIISASRKTPQYP